MSEVIYKEKQRFSDWLLYALLSLGIVATIYGLVHLWTSNAAHVTERAAICMLILAFFGIALYLLSRLRLKVTINDQGIKYKMSPFHRKSKRIPWEEVATCEVIKTPIYGRWNGGNIHFLGERLFSLTGRNGLSVTTRDGHKYFIGVGDVDALSEALQIVQARLGKQTAS